MLISRQKEIIETIPEIEFDKPGISVQINKMFSHLKDQNELDKIQDVESLLKDLKFWKLKNKENHFQAKSKN